MKRQHAHRDERWFVEDLPPLTMRDVLLSIPGALVLLLVIFAFTVLALFGGTVLEPVP